MLSPVPLPGCEPGSFGEGCSQQCDCELGVPCDPITGHCLCPPGRMGASCELGESGYRSVGAGVWVSVGGVDCVSGAQWLTGGPAPGFLLGAVEACPASQPPPESLGGISLGSGGVGPGEGPPVRWEGDLPDGPASLRGLRVSSSGLLAVLPLGSLPDRQLPFASLGAGGNMGKRFWASARRPALSHMRAHAGQN